MLRNTRKTEVYSVSVVDGKRTLLFSDEGMNLEIKATGAVSPAGKAYMAGTWREWRTTPTRSIHSEDGIYEISLDGCKQFRRILDAQPHQAPALLNSQATKAAFQMSVNGKVAVSVYAVPEWKLLHKWDLGNLIQAHCPLCDAMSHGWLADGNRLFFELDLAGENEVEKSKNGNAPGTYIVSEDGTKLRGISPEIGAFQLVGYLHPNDIERHFIGLLPDGSYVFQDYGVQKGRPFSELEPFLVVANPGSKSHKQFRLRSGIARGVLSSSGKYLPYVEHRQTRDNQTEVHLWVKDLESGEDKELLVVPPPNRQGPPQPNVILWMLGWRNEN